MNIPGGLVAAFTVELKGLGRKGTMSIGAFMTGTFLLAGTTASTSNQLLAWNCVYGFAGTLMAGALYGMSFCHINPPPANMPNRKSLHA